MFSSLRRKFVASSVLVVTIVIFVVAGALNYVNYVKVEQRTDEILQQFSTNENFLTLINNEDGNTIINSKNTTSDSSVYNGFSAVRVDDARTIKKYYNDDAILKEKDGIHNLLEDALKDDNNKGYIDSYRFLKTKTDSGTIVLFLNCERDLGAYISFFKTSMLLSGIVIFSVLLLMVVISKKVIQPIQQSYTKQKQFITDASHELKTPLTIIRSNADVLEIMGGESKWTKNIQNQVDRLTSLVNSLVVFSRMEERETLERNIFSLSEAIKNRVDDFSELANFQDKRIITSIEDVSYNGEKQTIIQLVDILLDNAIKYAPKGSDVSVELLKNRKYATLRIFNAAEVKKGDLSKVFDRFYRLDESRNSDIKGYGIGLSLAKVIAEKHKEQITAYAPEDGIFEIKVKFTLENK